jgi:hypothetical protein
MTKIQRFEENKNYKGKRYYFSCTGYFMFDLMAQKYRAGRIEMYDNENPTGYASEEFFYCVPYDMSEKFENFFEDLETDLPFHVEFWSMNDCREACAEALGITVEQLQDREFVKQWQEKQKDQD